MRDDRIVIDDPRAGEPSIDLPDYNLLCSTSSMALARGLPQVLPLPLHGQLGYVLSRWGADDTPIGDIRRAIDGMR